MFSLGALDQFALVNEWQTTREFPHIEFACQVLSPHQQFLIDTISSTESYKTDHKGQALDFRNRTFFPWPQGGF